MIFASKRAESRLNVSLVLKSVPRLALLVVSWGVAAGALSACGGAEEPSQKNASRVRNASDFSADESSVGSENLISDSSPFRNELNPDRPEWFVPATLQKAVAKFQEMLVETPHGSRKLTVRVSNEQALFDGDIVVNMPSKADSTTESFGRSSAGYLWANGTIAYTFDSRIPAVTRQRVQEAIQHWNSTTRLRLVPRTNQLDFVTFRDGTGCSSNVGRTGGQQFISLAGACGTGNAIHEIGHAFGLWHEQSRTDRDSVVTVFWQNVDPAFKGNFEIEQTGSALLTTYDINSIMQYGSTAFARTTSSGRPLGPTMLLKNGRTFEAQRTALSAQDIAGVQKMYGF